MERKAKKELTEACLNRLTSLQMDLEEDAEKNELSFVVLIIKRKKLPQTFIESSSGFVIIPNVNSILEESKIDFFAHNVKNEEQVIEFHGLLDALRAKITGKEIP
jgi:lipoate synthase